MLAMCIIYFSRDLERAYILHMHAYGYIYMYMYVCAYTYIRNEHTHARRTNDTTVFFPLDGLAESLS